MEPSKVQEIKRFLQDNYYPDGCSSKEHYYIKRRCENFTLKGVLSWSHHIQVIFGYFYLIFYLVSDGELHYICRRKKDKHLAKVLLVVIVGWRKHIIP